MPAGLGWDPAGFLCLLHVHRGQKYCCTDPRQAIMQRGCAQHAQKPARRVAAPVSTATDSIAEGYEQHGKISQRYAGPGKTLAERPLTCAMILQVFKSDAKPANVVCQAFSNCTPQSQIQLPAGGAMSRNVDALGPHACACTSDKQKRHALWSGSKLVSKQDTIQLPGTTWFTIRMGSYRVPREHSTSDRCRNITRAKGTGVSSASIHFRCCSCCCDAWLRTSHCRTVPQCLAVVLSSEARSEMLADWL